jgi:hypothetical protein
VQIAKDLHKKYESSKLFPKISFPEYLDLLEDIISEKSIC